MPVATAARSRGGFFNGSHGRSGLFLGSARESDPKLRRSERRSSVSQRTFAGAFAANDVGMWSAPLTQQTSDARRAGFLSAPSGES